MANFLSQLTTSQRARLLEEFRTAVMVPTAVMITGVHQRVHSR